MNTRRAAALCRELADLDAKRAELQRELAEAMVDEPERVANDTEARRLAGKVRARSVPVTLPTDVEITDVDRAKAARALRKMGHRVR